MTAKQIKRLEELASVLYSVEQSMATDRTTLQEIRSAIEDIRLANLPAEQPEEQEAVRA